MPKAFDLDETSLRCSMLSRRAFGIGLASTGVVGVLGLPNLVRQTVVKVVGFGSAGCHVVAAMIHAGITSVEYIAVGTTDGDFTDGAAPGLLVAPVLLATSVGTGMIDFGQARPADHPDRGRLAAVLAGADMVVLVGGLSIRSGSGAAVLVADVARKVGAVVVAVATYEPANDRGRQTAHAVRGLTTLGVPIVFWPIARILANPCALEPASWADGDCKAQALAAREIGRVAQALAALAPLALDQMQAAFSLHAGKAIAGMASASAAAFADDVGRAAAERAICTPLVNLEAMLTIAPWVLVNVTCSCRLEEAPARALAEVQRVAPRGARFVFAGVQDETLADEVRVTVIAGGVSAASERWWWKRRCRASRPAKASAASAPIRSRERAAETQRVLCSRFTCGREGER